MERKSEADLQPEVTEEKSDNGPIKPS